MAVQLWRIAGLDNYSISRAALVRRDAGVRSNATTGSGPDDSFLGSDMRAAYYGGTALTGAGQSLGLLEFLGTDLADLNTYYANVHQTNSVPITLKSVDGQSTSCTEPSCDDTEQTLDMTQALGMAPGLSSLVMYIGATGDDASILNAMATANPLNAQLSSSWTWYPSDPGTDNPYFNEFAAQGQSFFQASGDCGEWTTAVLEHGCAPKNLPSLYPADDPYVASVGGTDLTTVARGAPGVRKPPGKIAAVEFRPRPTILPFHPGRPPRPAAARPVPRPTAMARMFRRTRTGPFTFAPTKPLVLKTIGGEPVLRHPCGPVTWLSSINKQWLTETRRWASSIRRSIRLVWDRAMTPPFTTSRAAARQAAIAQPPDTTW